MTDKQHHSRNRRALKRWDALRRAFAEFLLLPSLIIAGFLLLSMVTFALDRGDVQWLVPLRELMRSYVFADAAASGQLLATIAAGMITITSITVSLLLIALQQSAGSLTHQVYDQFLRTWHNQAYFGVFVGLCLYSLITLASVGPLIPVLGGTVALLGAVLALCLLLLLFYTTVNQMRPVVIIEAIHNHALMARKVHADLLRATRRTPTLESLACTPVDALAHGFVTRIDVDAIRAAAAGGTAEVEVVLRVTLGTYVVFGQRLADVHARAPADARRVADVLEVSIHREDKRDITCDPLDAVEELETIGWTSISTAQSDPDAGVLTIYSLRDILARWAAAPDETPAPQPEAAGVSIVYVDDVMPKLLNAFESLAVAASESLQHQSCAEILRSFEIVFDRLPPQWQQRAEDIVLRMLSGLGDHVLTAELESALSGIVDTFESAGRGAAAGAVREAKGQLARSIGKLGSRVTRMG